jgi:hypothetical protein
VQLVTLAALSDAEIVQVSESAVGEALVAVICPTAPATNPLKVNVGVESDVKLSAGLLPRSESAARSGAERVGRETMPLAEEVLVTLVVTEKAVLVPVTTDRKKYPTSPITVV